MHWSRNEAMHWSRNEAMHWSGNEAMQSLSAKEVARRNAKLTNTMVSIYVV